MKVMKIAAIVAALVGATGAHAGTVVNGGFENGLTNWAALMPDGVKAVTSATAHDGTVYSATQGNYFALLTGGSLPLNGFIGEATTGTLMLTGVTVGSGETLKFDWAFLGKDYMPYNDFAGVSFSGVLNGQSFTQTTTLASIASVGNYGDTGWKTFSFAPGGNFVGSMTLFSANAKDSAQTSLFAVDNVQVGVQVAAVPEPETYAMFMAGLGIMGAVARRRSRRA